jgi:TolB-like protein
VIHRFGEFELDHAAGELRCGASAIPLERQVFELLRVLVENDDRLITRDELIEKVWDGRVVSDSAIASRVKSARRAIGDDGKTQRWIRTLHGRGFRFVGEVETVGRASVESRSAAGSELARSSPASLEPDPRLVPTREARPSIAVLPFSSVSRSDVERALGEAIADDVLSELARLRWLFVIARGSSFRFRSETHDLEQVRAALGVRYCLTGSVELEAGRATVSVQLADTAGGNVVWADRISTDARDIHPARSAIVSRLVASLDLEIPVHEAELARLTDPASLDAWSLFHVGVQRMFRFNRSDNDAAGALFERAVALDPSFSRAHAGLSFVCFQKSFLRYTGDPAAEARLARGHAERAVDLDERDPFAHVTMGRCHWLDGDLEGSRPWLERATALSPSYAHGIYARAWTSALSGRGREGIGDADLAMALSPLDPLHYAMAATRSLSLVASAEVGEAAQWADTAARSPGAHVLIALIAAAVHELGGDAQRAKTWAANVRGRRPDLGQADFFRSFPFAHEETRQTMAAALARLGF